MDGMRFLTIRGPVFALEDTMDPMSRLQLLAQD